MKQTVKKISSCSEHCSNIRWKCSSSIGRG